MNIGTSFRITVKFHNESYRYTVTLKEISSTQEIYQLSTKSEKILFINNRPLLLAKGLKHWVPKWKCSKQMIIDSFANDIIKQIEAKIGIKQT